MTNVKQKPRLRMSFTPEGVATRALAFSLPSIPGIPETDTLLLRGFRGVAESAAFNMVPRDEAGATLAALTETIGRAAYHKARFTQCLEHAKARRQALGGPVVGDWHAVPPISREAIAYLGAVRTAVDIIVYLAARRVGKSERCAAGWAAQDAILPKSEQGQTRPSRYDLPEILAIRAHNPWFEEVNLFRNGTYHRGWKEDLSGFYSSGDSAEEASDPQYNAMLLPDMAVLRAKLFPHRWTFREKRRLDTMVDTCDTTFQNLLTHILTKIWMCDIPAPGTIPKEDQPNMMLYLPAPLILTYPDCRVVPVFDSRPAARAFREYGNVAQQRVVRAIRPTRIGDDAPAFLIPIPCDDVQKPHEVRLYTLVGGLLQCEATVRVEPTKDGPLKGLMSFQVLDERGGLLYIWQIAR